MGELLRLDGVSRDFGTARPALEGVSFVLAAGEMAFVTGHSGAGKSTLLRLINGSDRPTAGTVIFEGRNLGRLDRRSLPAHRRRVATVFQDHRLLPDRSVFENVALPLRIAGEAETQIGKRVRSVLERLGLGERAAARPHRLSAGEQQRVGIARAIVARPSLLVADEPTGNLDPQLAAEVMQLFAELPQRGTSVLVASHDLFLIKRMRRRTLVLDHGRLIDDFRPDEEGAA
ncbi:MAG: ABC transporter ATP-binding protein [Lysobacteraceae bacterium]|nr:MAG: ABC transporter ATP-binding protein [Xanthomonadaceae bacterium]